MRGHRNNQQQNVFYLIAVCNLIHLTKDFRGEINVCLIRLGSEDCVDMYYLLNIVQCYGSLYYLFIYK